MCFSILQLSAIWTAVVTVVATPASVVAIRAGPDRNANNYPAIPDARNTANAGTARASARKAGTDATARSVSNFPVELAKAEQV